MRQLLVQIKGSLCPVRTEAPVHRRHFRFIFRQVLIPARVSRLKGKGMPGTGGGEPGDLLLKVTVGTRPGYERKGSDVYTTISIPYTTAVFGGEATVPHPLRKCYL